jgi:hypothetical protein
MPLQHGHNYGDGIWSIRLWSLKFGCAYSHLSNKRTGWNKRVLRADFFCYYMKKWLLLHRNKRAGRAKAQKSISEAARLLDR